MNNTTQAPPIASKTAAAAIGAAGYAAYSNTIVGHAAPKVDWYRKRVSDPQPGDIVVETSSFRLRERQGEAHAVVGYFIKKQMETVSFDEPELNGDEGYTRMVWYIQPLTGGDVVTWENCDWIAVPSSFEQALAFSQPPA